jgi:peroxiredoxin
MREDLVAGAQFPNVGLPDHTGQVLRLSEIAWGHPLILAFSRGWWCPKDVVRMRMLVSLQDEIQCEYGRIAVVTVDPPYVNGAFRAGLGATFPFLSDADRATADDLDLLELTDATYRPYLPFTFVLDSTLSIHRFWCGFWYWGNPTPDEFRVALREITRSEQPTYDAQAVWTSGGRGAADAGIDAPVVWVREDPEGREIYRGAYHGDVPDVGAEVTRSVVDGRPWVVYAVEREDGRVVVRQRKMPAGSS